MATRQGSAPSRHDKISREGAKILATDTRPKASIPGHALISSRVTFRRRDSEGSCYHTSSATDHVQHQANAVVTCEEQAKMSELLSQISAVSVFLGIAAFG